MKNFLNGLHVLWAVATAVLFYLVLAKPSAGPEVLAVPTASKNLPGIYYINFDSLSAKATYIQEMRTNSEARQRSMSRQFEQSGQSLQREIEEYQKKAGSLSPIQRQLTEQDLTKKQQELMTLRDRMTEQLSREEAQQMESMMNTIKSFLGKQKSLGSIAYVLAYQRSSNILLANDSLDITRQVLDGLNAQHAEELKAKSKK